MKKFGLIFLILTLALSALFAQRRGRGGFRSFGGESWISDDAKTASPEAFLFNTLHRTPPLRLRSNPMSGYDTFRIMDEDR